MRLRLKILSGFLILAFMLSIAGIWSIYELQSIGTSVQQLLEDNYKSIDASKIMLEALEREDSGILLLLSGKWHEGRVIIADGDTLFEEGLQIATHNITIPGEQSYVDAIRKKYQSYKNLWEKPIVDTQREGSLDWYFVEIHKSFLDVKSSVNNLMSLNDQTMFKTASNLQNKANRAIMPGVVAIISAIVFTILFNFFVNHYFVNPIIQITHGIRKYLDSNISFQLEFASNDEISDLAKSINELCALKK